MGASLTNHSAWRHEFSTFLSKLELKVERGALDYGDRSFELPPDRLFEELEAELLDICGWGFVLWVRLQKMREAMARDLNRVG